MHKLSNETAQLISSAQVITCASNAIKELVENSIDAGATCIDVKLEGFGLERIEVRDNGAGMLDMEMKHAAQRHYTSKITTHDDLRCLETYGFRGEALSSLCEVGGVTVITRTKDQHFSTTYTLDSHGCISGTKPSHCPQGTTVIVSNLFNNLPVRKQYFKSMTRKKEQLKLIEEHVMGFYLANFSIRLSLFHDKCLVWRAPKSTTLKSALVNVLGSKTMSQFHQKQVSNDSIKLCLFMAKMPILKKSSERTFVIINKRPVRNKSIDKMLRSFCKKALEGNEQTGKSASAGWPTMLLTIQVPLDSVDANMNPNKTQVMLTVEDEVLTLLKQLLYQDDNDAGNDDPKSTSENNYNNNSIASNAQADFNNTFTSESVTTNLDTSTKINSIFCPDDNSSKSNMINSDKKSDHENEKNYLNHLNEENITTTSLKDMGHGNSDLIIKKSNCCTFDVLDDEIPFSSTLKHPLLPNNSQEFCLNQSLGISEIEVTLDKHGTMEEHEKYDPQFLSNGTNEHSATLKQNCVENEKIKSWSRGDQFGNSTLSQSSIQPVKMYTGGKGGDLLSVMPTSRKRNSDEIASLKQSTLDNNLLGEPKLKNPRSEFCELSTENNCNSFEKNRGFNFLNATNKTNNSNCKKSRSKHRRSFAIEKFCSALSQTQEKKKNSESSDDENIEIQTTKLKFKFSDLKSKVMSLIPTDFSTFETVEQETKIIGDLNDYNSVVIRTENNLLIPNLFRMQEKIIYENLMRNHKLKPVELDSNLEITENNIGINAFNVLHNLPGEALNEVSFDETICDDRISSNGFQVIRIKQSKDSVLSYEVHAMCCTVPYYGLSDLKEVLEAIDVDQHIQLHECRPLKIQFYLQSESARVCKSMQPNQIIEDFSENLKFFKDLNLLDAKCFHNKSIFHQIFNLSKLN